jgi:hypothetical protein
MLIGGLVHWKIGIGEAATSTPWPRTTPKEQACGNEDSNAGNIGGSSSTRTLVPPTDGPEMGLMTLTILVGWKKENVNAPTTSSVLLA